MTNNTPPRLIGFNPKKPGIVTYFLVMVTMSMYGALFVAIKEVHGWQRLIFLAIGLGPLRGTIWLARTDLPEQLR